MDETSTEYKGVTLPSKLIEEVDKRIQNNNFGFRSRAEYICFCIRKQLDEDGGGGGG